MSADVLISIVTNNSQAVIGKCLDSISSACEKYQYCVCVLDNASLDATITIIKEDHPEVQVIESKVKQGFGANQNIVLRKYTEKCSYILILNDDVFLSKNCIDNLIDVLSSDEQIGAVCPSLYFPNGEPQVSGASTGSIPQEILRLFKIGRLMPPSLKNALNKQPDWLKRLFGTSVLAYLKNYEPNENLRFVGYLSGACLLVRSCVLIDVGLFDELFHMYYEDTDWGRRAVASGWKLAVVPSESAIHHTQHSMGAFSIIESERSKFAYYKKYKHSSWGLACLAVLTALIYAIKYIDCKIFMQSSQQKLSMTTAYSTVIRNSLRYL